MACKVYHSKTELYEKERLTKKEAGLAAARELAKFMGMMQ